MFELSEAYAGEMVTNTPTGDNTSNPENPVKQDPKTADEILQYAREEAAEILEKAHEEAKLFVSQKEKEIDEEADRKIALKVNEAFTSMGEDLFSARASIANIVEESIHLMIGAVGNEHAFSLAVDKATRAYINNNNLKIHAHPDSANRLRLYNINAKSSDEKPRYEIIDDPNLDADRCLLDTGEKRIEVSLELQIQALKNSLKNNLAGK